MGICVGAGVGKGAGIVESPQASVVNSNSKIMPIAANALIISGHL